MPSLRRIGRGAPLSALLLALALASCGTSTDRAFTGPAGNCGPAGCADAGPKPPLLRDRMIILGSLYAGDWIEAQNVELHISIGKPRSMNVLEKYFVEAYAGGHDITVI